MTEPENTRNKLQARISAGDLDGDIALIMQILREVLLTVEQTSAMVKDIKAQVDFRLVCAAIAMREIGTIYAYLQDFAPLKRQAEFAKSKAIYLERLERALVHIEKSSGITQ